MQTSRCHTVLAVLLLPLLGCGALPATEGGASPEADAGPAQHAPDGASGVTSDADADGGVRSGSPCAAVAGFGSTAEAAGEIDLSWTPQAGVAFSLQRKSYCGSDGYELLAMLPAGSSTYADKDVQPSWVYWYELTATDSAGSTASGAIAVQAATGGAPGCGGTPQPSGVASTCDAAGGDAAPAADSSSPPTSDAGSDSAATTDDAAPAPPATGCGGASLPTPGGPTPTTANTKILHPGDDVAAAVTGCSGGAVLFSAGTYALGESIDVPSHCTLEGEPGGVSIITGNGAPNGQGNGIFNLANADGVTVENLHFDHADAECLYGNSTLAQNLHIVGNWFSNIGADGAIFLYNIQNAVLEANIFENVSGDGMHLLFFGGGNTTARWNFGAGIGGVALVEAQNGPNGLLVCENVFYSKAGGASSGIGLSIATGGTNGGGVGAVNVVLDGNIILDDGLPTVNSNDASQWDAMEVMGTTPTVRNNFVRRWGSGAIFSNVTGTPIVTGNTFCATGYAYPLGTEPGWNSSIASLPSMSQVEMSNTIAASCSGVAIPPLPSPVRVPPDLLTSGALPLPDGTTWTPSAAL